MNSVSFSLSSVLSLMSIVFRQRQWSAAFLKKGLLHQRRLALFFDERF
jgi:hypothetical protein